MTHATYAQQSASSLSARDVVLYGQLLAMTDTRQLDTVLVDRLLATPARALRAAAALAIGQVGAQPGSYGASKLRALLRDADTKVAANAAYALGLLRDSTSLPALNSALAASPIVAREAAWALGEIGGSARREIMLGLDATHDDATTTQLLLASAKLRPVPVASVRPFFKASAPSVVWAAAYAIARQRAPAGLRDLMALQGSNSGLVRAEVARALTKPATSDSLRNAAITVLTRLVRDNDPHVRINALRSLGTYGAESKAMIVQATRDKDANVRIAAAQSLGTVLTSGSTDFPSLWAADTSSMYRSSLLASATRAGLRPAQLTQWAKSQDWHLRAAVASATGDSLDRAFAMSRTIQFLDDRDARVREAAYGAIAPPASMPLEDTVHKILLRGVRDPDFYVRATAIAALTDRASIDDLPQVMASYRAYNDSANDARLAALQYAAAVWKKDSGAFDARLRQRLAAFPVPADPLERAAGRDLPFWKTWGAVKPTARPASWYDNVVRSMVVPSLSGKRPHATIHTVRGPIELELFGDDAPITAWNFLSLARSGYYRDTRFHRVVPNFVAQDGDPRDDGNGGPGYAIRDEMNPNRYERGAVGMALSGPDTGGSQYFITHSPQPHLDGHYTVFGKVVRGFDVLDRIVQGDLITSVEWK